jgi:tetratricopeptide (TPR) repeat protein
LVLKKKIREFKTYTFNIGNILNMRARTQLREASTAEEELTRLVTEKQIQFDEITRLIRDYNTRHSAHYSPINLGDTLKDRTTEIPPNATSMIQQINKDIKTLSGMRGGGKTQKMKGGMKQEGMFIIGEEPLDYFDLTKLKESVGVITRYYSKIKETPEFYIEENQRLRRNIENMKNRINLRNYLERNFKELLPELKQTRLGDTHLEDNRKKGIIISAIVGTNVSVNTQPSDALEHIKYLNFMLFDTRGDELLKRRNYGEAISYYEEALRGLFPEHLELKEKLAEALSQSQGNNDDAIRHFEEALREQFLNHPGLMGKLAEAHSAYGNNLMESRNYDDAIRHYGEALEIFPEDQGLKGKLEKAKNLGDDTKTKRLRNEVTENNNYNQVVPKISRIKNQPEVEYDNAFSYPTELFKKVHQEGAPKKYALSQTYFGNGFGLVPGQLVKPLTTTPDVGVVPEGPLWGGGGSRKKTSKKKKPQKKKNKKTKKLNKRKN